MQQGNVSTRLLDDSFFDDQTLTHPNEYEGTKVVNVMPRRATLRHSPLRAGAKSPTKEGGDTVRKTQGKGFGGLPPPVANTWRHSAAKLILFNQQGTKTAAAAAAGQPGGAHKLCGGPGAWLGPTERTGCVA